MTDIIAILNTDATLLTLLGANKVFPYETTTTGSCIVYSYRTVNNNKITKTVQLTLRIIADTMTKCQAIEDAVSTALVTFGDEPLNAQTLKCEINGSGDLYDSDARMYQKILYFNLIRK